LMGYPLGKAQLLTALFGHWEPFYIHDSVYELNGAYQKLGVPLRDGDIFSEAEKKGLLSRTRPWVMISPLMRSSNFVRFVKQKYAAVCVGFSGWALDKRYGTMMGLDHALAMSDHCDYAELLEIVRASGANKIYTFHGFSHDFADSLKKLGFDAQPLAGSKIRKKNKENRALLHTSLDAYI
jgi:putative mRNA 3-end processing factor